MVRTNYHIGIGTSVLGDPLECTGCDRPRTHVSRMRYDHGGYFAFTRTSPRDTGSEFMGEAPFDTFLEIVRILRIETTCNSGVTHEKGVRGLRVSGFCTLMGPSQTSLASKSSISMLKSAGSLRSPLATRTSLDRSQ